MDNSGKNKKQRKQLKPKNNTFTTSPWTLKKPLYLKKNDTRYNRHMKQLKKLGYSDSETWSLFSPICQFILPRLKRFKEIAIAHPGGITMEEWIEILEKMIFAFEWAITEDEEENYSLPEEVKAANWEKYEEGMTLFGKWFRGLWW